MQLYFPNCDFISYTMTSYLTNVCFFPHNYLKSYNCNFISHNMTIFLIVNFITIEAETGFYKVK